MPEDCWWTCIRGGVASPSTRLKSVQLLMKLNELTWAQAEEVEAGVAQVARDDVSHVAASKRICYNGVCDPVLFQRFPLGDLACLADSQLRCTALALLDRAEEERGDAISAMLQEKYDNVNSTSVQYSMLRCRSCKGTEITWQQKQTRGADESMTIFCQCGSCGTRWKMS